MNTLKDNLVKTKANEELPFLKNILALRDELGINLDRFYDIQALLGTFVTTQTRNAYETKEGKFQDRIKVFQALFNCNDPSNYQRVIGNFVSPYPGVTSDAISENQQIREKFRAKIYAKLPKNPPIPMKQASLYDLSYEPQLGIEGY